MEKVYAVFDDGYLEAIFATRKEADDFARDENEKRIYKTSQLYVKPYIIGAPEDTSSYKYFQVIIDKDGKIVSVGEADYDVREGVRFGPTCDFCGLRYSELVINVHARDKEHATKIADERRVKLIVSRNWK